MIDFTWTESNKPEDRKNTWMRTSSGKRFCPLNPNPDDIVISDIGWALAQTCRYGGHVPPPYFYTVAEHSWLLSEYFLSNKESIYLARWAFVHDFSEAYIGDIIRPIKPSLPDFKIIEHDLEHTIWRRFGFEGDLPKEVYDADKLICNDEQLQLWSYEICMRDGLFERPRLNMQIKCWKPEEAYKMFMDRAHEFNLC